jgi:hypothetical protein
MPSDGDQTPPTADLASALSTKPHVINSTKAIGNVVYGHADLHALRFGILEDVYSPVEFAKLDHYKSG